MPQTANIRSKTCKNWQTGRLWETCCILAPVAPLNLFWEISTVVAFSLLTISVAHPPFLGPRLLSFLHTIVFSTTPLSWLIHVTRKLVRMIYMKTKSPQSLSSHWKQKAESLDAPSKRDVSWIQINMLNSQVHTVYNFQIRDGDFPPPPVFLIVSFFPLSNNPVLLSFSMMRKTSMLCRVLLHPTLLLLPISYRMANSEKPFYSELPSCKFSSMCLWNRSLFQFAAGDVKHGFPASN